MGNRLLKAAKSMVRIYFGCRVHRSAAAISYYLVMTVFPFLICLSFILDAFELSEELVFAIFDGIIPADAMELFVGHVEYIGSNRGKMLFFTGMVVMLSSSSAAFRCITAALSDIQGNGMASGVRSFVSSFVFSIIFLIVVYISSLIVFSGEWLVGFLEPILGFSQVWTLWKWLRFILLFLLLYFMIFAIYRYSQYGTLSVTACMPGALIASSLLVVVSVVFSWLITNSVRITVVYGSIASVIILLTWLFVCGNILIMGNVFNIWFHRLKHGGKTEDAF